MSAQPGKAADGSFQAPSGIIRSFDDFGKRLPSRGGSLAPFGEVDQDCSDNLRGRSMSDFRSIPNLSDVVIERVKERQPNIQNPRVIFIQDPFLNGKLFSVSFDLQHQDGTITSHLNRAYVQKRRIQIFGFDEEIFRIVGETHSRSFYDTFANTDAVSGIIAIVVTLLVVPSFLIAAATGHSISIPDWISSGWLLILGFYFGKSSGGRS